MNSKLRLILLLFGTLNLSINSYSQNSYVDSLNLALKQAKQDTLRIKLTMELGEAIYINEPKDAIDLWTETKTLCEKSLIKVSTAALRKFYLRYLASAFNNIGYVSSNQGGVSKALKFYGQSLEIQKELADQLGIASTLNNMGLIYKYQGDISNAIEYYHRSLKIYENMSDKPGIAITLSNIGVIYDSQGESRKAIDYFFKSLKIREEVGEKFAIAHSQFKIGSVYMNKGEISKALDYFNKSLKIREDINDKEGVSYCLNLIGQIYRNRGETDNSLKYFQKSLQLSKEIDDKKGEISSLNFIAEIMLKNGNMVKAQENAYQGFELANELGFPEFNVQTASTLKKIYRKQGKYKDALKMYEFEIQMRDSINNQETKKASIKKQFQYEYEKKAAADSVKHTEEQKVKNAQLQAQAASLKQEETQRYALYGGLLLVIGFSLFVFNRFRVTQKQKKVIEEQKVLVDKAYEQLHEKNKEVMDSITYARRIQRALITPDAYIDKVLNKLNKNS